MTRTFIERIIALEEAALHSEGAQYALHDVLAFMVANTPENEARAMFETLADQVCVHADKIGEIRLAGYNEELHSLREEAGQARTDARGLLSRLARSLTGGEAQTQGASSGERVAEIVEEIGHDQLKMSD